MMRTLAVLMMTATPDCYGRDTVSKCKDLNLRIPLTKAVHDGGYSGCAMRR